MNFKETLIICSSAVVAIVFCITLYAAEPPDETIQFHPSRLGISCAFTTEVASLVKELGFVVNDAYGVTSDGITKKPLAFMWLENLETRKFMIIFEDVKLNHSCIVTFGDLKMYSKDDDESEPPKKLQIGPAIGA